MTTFHLIRHAEKDCDPELLTGRMAGIGLTARGRKQTEQLVRQLEPVRIERVFSSPLERARETAVMLAAPRGLTVEVSAALDEFDCGEWAGRTVAELAGEPVWQAFNTQRSTVRPPGGESALEVQARMVGQLLRWHREFPDGSVAVVSHGDPLRFAIGFFLGVPLDHFLRFELGMGSVSVLTLTDNHPVLLSLNQRPAEDLPDAL